MVDYGQNPEFIYYIESRLDEPVSIVGIKILNLFHIVFSLLITLILTGSMILAVIAFFSTIAISRKLYADEIKGDPTTHKGKLLKILLLLPKQVRVGICPSIEGLSDFNTKYRS